MATLAKASLKIALAMLVVAIGFTRLFDTTPWLPTRSSVFAVTVVLAVMLIADAVQPKFWDTGAIKTMAFWPLLKRLAIASALCATLLACLLASALDPSAPELRVGRIVMTLVGAAYAVWLGFGIWRRARDAWKAR